MKNKNKSKNVKNKNKNENSAWKLPKDVIVEEILPRMNGKSLLAFKCTSRFFQTLISTPEFIHRHLRQSLSSDSNRLLLTVGDHGDLHTVDLDSPKHRIVNFRTQGVNDSRLSIVGSCNGLVCLVSDLSFFIVCNPSTGMYSQFSCEVLRCSFVSYGFGFDDIHNDYKIVRVTCNYSYYFDHFGNDIQSIYEVRVYSMKSGSSSLVDCTSSRHRMKSTDTGAVIDNHLVHWRFYHPHDHKHRICCFDLRHESWRDDIALPDYEFIQKERDKENDLVHLGVLDEDLCLVTKSLESMNGFDVWVMKEYGVKESWVKLVSHVFEEQYVPISMYPIAYARGTRSKILFQVDEHNIIISCRIEIYKVAKVKFFWYNVKDNTMIRLDEFDDLPTFNASCISKPSLFPLASAVHFQVERAHD